MTTRGEARINAELKSAARRGPSSARKIRSHLFRDNNENRGRGALRWTFPQGMSWLGGRFYCWAWTRGTAPISCRSIMPWIRRSIWKNEAVFFPEMTLLKMGM
jgi:hypothetical protein